jgi:PAS domain S-box-containing protein
LTAKDSRNQVAISSKPSTTINRPLEANSFSLDEAQELVHVGSWQWNVGSGDIIWSDELYRIYGMRPQERPIGFEEFIQLIHPEDRARVNEIINEAYQTKHSFDFEHRIILPNKKIRILHGKGKVVSDESGNIVRMLGTSQDITERKKADQALHKSDERFNAVTAATSDVVYDIDLKKNTIWFNDALFTEYKYPKGKSPYTQEWRFGQIHPQDRQRIKASLDKLLHSSNKTWTNEYKFKKHDGTYIDVRDRAIVSRDAGGNATRIIGTILDITNQKELERAKDRFISLVSHQLRTPLSSMRIHSQMLANGYIGKLTPEQLDYLQKIESSTIRMIQLVNNILGVSKIESGRFSINVADTDISTLIQAQVDEVDALASSKGIKIAYTSNIKRQTIPADVILFGQLVHNLLTNAIRYTVKENTTIKIAFEKTEKEYLLTVKDRGIGIPKEAQSRIFSSFYRAENATLVQSDGNGLGLYLTKHILDITGGKIWFTSEEGKGSTFFVSFPLSGMRNNQLLESTIVT